MIGYIYIAFQILLTTKLDCFLSSSSIHCC